MVLIFQEPSTTYHLCFEAHWSRQCSCITVAYTCHQPKNHLFRETVAYHITSHRDLPFCVELMSLHCLTLKTRVRLHEKLHCTVSSIWKLQLQLKLVIPSFCNYVQSSQFHQLASGSEAGNLSASNHAQPDAIVQFHDIPPATKCNFTPQTWFIGMEIFPIVLFVCFFVFCLFVCLFFLWGGGGR